MRTCEKCSPKKKIRESGSLEKINNNEKEQGKENNRTKSEI